MRSAAPTMLPRCASATGFRKRRSWPGGRHHRANAALWPKVEKMLVTADLVMTDRPKAHATTA